MSARGAYVLLTFPPADAALGEVLRKVGAHWKPAQGGWLVEVRAVSPLVARLKAEGLHVRFGEPVTGEKPKRRESAFDRPLPPAAARGLDLGVSTKALQDVFFDPKPSQMPRPFETHWRSTLADLPTLEPVDVDRLDTSFEVPGFKGDLYGFQRQGVAFLRHLGMNGIVADEMGLGKTIEAIACALLLGERTLVVCPAAVKWNWAAEVERFSDQRARVLDLGGWMGPRDALFSVVNYDLLPRRVEELNEEKFGLLVLDEAHFVKNPAAKRSRAAYRLEAPRRILLTGTPLLNRAEELWPLLHLVQPGKWGTEGDFRRRFSRRPGRLAESGLEVAGAEAERLAELRERLRGTLIRRQKAQVLKELPAKTIEVQPVELDEASRPAYEALEDGFLEEIRERGIDRMFAGDTWLRTLARMHALKQFAIAQRQPFARRWLEEQAAAGEKVVVFSQYLAPIHELHRAFAGRSLLIDGAVPSAERLARARAFEGPGPQFLFGQMQAAGTGLNLTPARRVLFLDLAWTPAAHAQAMDRCHRIGQRRPVLVTFLMSPGTLDEHLERILMEKQAVINTVMGERQRILTERSVARAVAEEMLKARS